MQLAMSIPIKTRNGHSQILRALIDTSAEANLIRQGVLERHFFQPADDPIELIAANDQKLSGGTRTVMLDLFFTLMENGKMSEQKLSYPALCYEADISVDLILSFPWMHENRIGVFPHHRALVVDEPKLMLLFGEKEKGQTNPGLARRKINQISRLPALSGTDFNMSPKIPLVLPMSGIQNFETELKPEDYKVVDRNIAKISIIEAKTPEIEDPRIK